MTQRFGMTIKTRLSFDELDNVVGQYCQGDYSFSLGGLDDSTDGRRKIMLIWFSQGEDRDRVRKFFAMRAGTESGIPSRSSPKTNMAAA